MIGGILTLAVIVWYIMARKNPKKYAPFLKEPYGKKRGYIFIVLFFLTGFIGMAINPPPISNNTSTKTQSQTQEQSIASMLESSLNIDSQKSYSIQNILTSVGIESLKSISYDSNLVLPGKDVKGYKAVDKKGNHISIYLNNNNLVERIGFMGSSLYENGTIIQNLKDCTFSGNEQSTLRQIAEKITKERLKAPSTAKFPGISEYQFSKDKGIATVAGYVDAQNSYGAMLRTRFTMIYDVKNDKLVSYHLN